MALTEFPSPPDLKLEFKDMVLDGKNITVSPWSVENPHPGYGKDPNILNEFGHTAYPKWVNGTLVQNAEEEKALTNPPSEPSKAPPVVNNPWPTAK